MISSAPGIWQDGTSRRISLRVPAAPVTDLTTTVVMSFFFSFSVLVPEEGYTQEGVIAFAEITGDKNPIHPS